MSLRRQKIERGKWPKVSVVTVCYNAESFLEPTIRSVLGQDYPELEYVIVDGASTDNSLKVIGSFGDQIDQLVSEPDKGIYDAMNKGIQMAHGEYIWFMNAGDEIPTSDTLRNILAQGGDADFIYGKALRVDEQGVERSWHKDTPADGQLNRKSFLQGMVICHQAMILRKAIIPLYDLSWRLSGDLDWVIKSYDLADTHKYVDRYFVRYLDGGVSDTVRKESLRERYQIMKKHYGVLNTWMSHLDIGLRYLKRRRIN